MTSSDGTDSTTYTFRLNVLSTTPDTAYVWVDYSGTNPVAKIQTTMSSGNLWLKTERLMDGEWKPIGGNQGVQNVTISSNAGTGTSLVLGGEYRFTIYDADPLATPSTANILYVSENVNV